MHLDRGESGSPSFLEGDKTKTVTTRDFPDNISYYHEPLDVHITVLSMRQALQSCLITALNRKRKGKRHGFRARLNPINRSAKTQFVRTSCSQDTPSSCLPYLPKHHEHISATSDETTKTGKDVFPESFSPPFGRQASAHSVECSRHS